MADYAKMYKQLFRAVTQAIEILQVAQQQTEEIYIEAEEQIITLLPPVGGKNDEDGNQS